MRRPPGIVVAGLALGISCVAGCSAGGDGAPTAALASPPAASASPTSLATWVEARVGAATQNPGLQIYVRDGATVLSRAHGKAVVDPERAMTTDDSLMVASVTKPMVAVVAMRLIERGTLSLHDPVEKWLGDAVRPRTGMTVEDLLGMTSGLADYGDVPGWKGPGTTSSLDLVRSVKGMPLQFKPGTDGAYVNTNYAALGAVLEKATGRPLASLLKTEVFQPAQMTHSRLGGRTTAHGYTGTVDTTPPPAHFPSAAAGVVSTAQDLGAFLAALTDGTLVRPETLKEMVRERSRMEDGAYGLGLVSYVVPCGTAIGHFGRNDSFAAGAFVLPETHRIVAITANSGANDDLQTLITDGLCAG